MSDDLPRNPGEPLTTTVDMTRQGHAWNFGDRVGIESISPLRFMLDPAERAVRCLESLDPRFGPNVKPGDILFAGKNFGHGPGHDHAILALKETGMGGVVAHSFAPQFFRHAVDHGLLLAEYLHASSVASAGDIVVVDFATGRLVNKTQGTSALVRVPQGPAFDILVCGGLIPYLRRELHAS